jgi:hypothetical protein
MSLAESFAKTGFAKFINTTAGRIVRIIAGLVLIVLGILGGMNVGGIILIVLGLVPLTAGTLNLCIISGLLGGPLHLAEKKPKYN